MMIHDITLCERESETESKSKEEEKEEKVDGNEQLNRNICKVNEIVQLRVRLFKYS